MHVLLLKTHVFVERERERDYRTPYRNQINKTTLKPCSHPHWLKQSPHMLALPVKDVPP